jgi:hypothetical protein
MSKKIPKILIISFLFIFAFQLVGLIFLIAAPKPLLADTAELDLQVDIPGSSFEKLQPYGSTKAIGEYIKAIYTYAIGIVGILAAVVLMFGGVLWITAGGNNERISNAKSWIAASLSGLVLALCSYMILYTINPNLVEFKITGVDKVEKGLATGCCAKGDIYLGIITEKQCKTKEGLWGGESSYWDSANKKCSQKEYTTIGCCLYDDNYNSRIYCKNETENKCTSPDTFTTATWSGPPYECNQAQTACEAQVY